MATNSENSVQDTEMAECDGEKVVTMMDVLKEQQDFEEDANAVLGASDEKNCTYSKGYVKRQALYACITCCGDAKEDPSKRAGTCLACSLVCHENHEVVELYTKRNFRCDCGNPKFNSHPCQFNPLKNDLNEDNNYDQNFIGLYCTCHRPYPDPESKNEDDMIQCIICEDWYHAKHLEAVVPANDQYSEMVCKDCMEKNMFLHNYSHLAVCSENADIDVINGNDSSVENMLPHKNLPSEICDTLPDTEVKDPINEITQDKLEISIKTISEETYDIYSKNEEQATIGTKENIDLNTIESKKIGNIESQKVLFASNSTEVLKEENVLKEDFKSNAVNIENALDPSQCTQIAEDQSTQLLTVNKENTSDESQTTQIGADQNTPKLFIEKGLNISESTIDVEDTTSQVQNEIDAEKLEEDRLLADPSPEEEQELRNKEKKDLTSENNKPIENGDIPETTEVLSKQCEENVEESKLLDDLTKNNIRTSTETLLDDINEVTEDKNPSECSDLKEENKCEYNDLPLGSEKDVKDSVVTSEDQLMEDKTEGQECKNDSTFETSNMDTEDVEMNSSNIVSSQDPSISKIEFDHSIDENTTSNEKHNLDHKRKLPTEDIKENVVCIKKAKHRELDPCVRPKGVKKIHNGATFWPSDFRQKLCTCRECLSMYKELSVLFLIDPEDTVTAYENLGKEKVRTEGHQSEYEKGLEALLSLDRIQQINAVTEYNKLRDKLLDFLKSFKDRQAIVKEEDIKAFFAGMKPKREPDGVYFCR